MAETLLGRKWKTDAGTELANKRCLVDANWGHSTEVVYCFCQQSPFPSVVTPSHSRFVGASSKPLSEYEKRHGDRVGWNWRIPGTTHDRPVKHVVFDANFWKSFIQARLLTAIGDRGALMLFGDDPVRHRLLADHLTAEYCIQTAVRGRVVDEWKLRLEQPNNQWLSALVGSAVGASMRGTSLRGAGAPVQPVRRVFQYPRSHGPSAGVEFLGLRP